MTTCMYHARIHAGGEKAPDDTLRDGPSRSLLLQQGQQVRIHIAPDQAGDKRVLWEDPPQLLHERILLDLLVCRDDVLQEDRGWLNTAASLNMRSIVFTWDTSQFSMG